MAKATQAQLMSLKAITGESWAGYGLTKEQASKLIAEYERAEQDYGAEVAKEALADVQSEMGEGDGNGEGAPGEGDDGEGNEGEGEGEAEAEVEAEQAGASLEDIIIHTVKRRRDEVLEGLEFGGGAHRVVVETPDSPEPKDMGIQHKLFPKLLKLLTLKPRRPVLLVGPAGSSKTSSVKAAAEALGINFYATSNSVGDMPSDKFGYNDAHGEFVDRALTRSIREASIFLDDEVDSTNPRIGVKMNMLIDNRYAEIGGEMIQAHDDWRYVGSGNTYGYGADRVYVGRNQLDAATLNRFLVLEWDYDEGMEQALAPNAAWCEYVWKVRHVVNEHKMRYVVGTRQILYGGQLIESGFDWDDAKAMTLFPGWKNDDVARVVAEVGE